MASKTPKELTTLLEQVSGSEELKKEYDRLDEVKSQMEEKVAFNFQKRRGITAERKQKKEQKEEAERHLELLEKQVIFCILDIIFNASQCFTHHIGVFVLYSFYLLYFTFPQPFFF